jgi:hypothetical protein
MDRGGHRRPIVRRPGETEGTFTCYPGRGKLSEVGQGDGPLAVEASLQWEILITEAVERLLCHVPDRRVEEIVVDARYDEGCRAKQVGPVCPAREFTGADDRLPACLEVALAQVRASLIDEALARSDDRDQLVGSLLGIHATTLAQAFIECKTACAPWIPRRSAFDGAGEALSRR